MAMFGGIKGDTILGMGNPLLDISDDVDGAFLTKYGLDENNAILAEEKHTPLYAELAARPKVQYIAGGATQNSVRVAQWMLQEAGKTAYMGAVGEDTYSQKMRDALKQDGVDAQYMVDKSVPTGTCAVCINGVNRSLVANLSAANNYKASHLKEASNFATLQKAGAVYSAGFFVTHEGGAESIDIASKEVAKSGGLYCMNLSAPFLMQVPPFKAVFAKTMPLVDVLFGNETEARTWAETEGWESENVDFIATRLSLIPSAKGRHRMVVITQGAESTIVAQRGHTTTYPIVPLPKEKIVDTNGAGDAYVGGFLAALVKGKDVKGCHEAGAYSASVIIQQSGCACPGKPDHKL